MEVLVCLVVLEALEPKVCPDLPVWMDSMDFLEQKEFRETQVGAEEDAKVLQVFKVRREREASPTQEVQASQEQRGRGVIQVAPDSQGSQVDQALRVHPWGQMFLDLQETLAFQDLMENMVSKVLQVALGLLALALYKETGVILASQVFLGHLAGRENLVSLEAPDSLAAPVSKVKEVRLASAEVLV